MTQLSELDPQDDKFKSILVPMAKDVKELQEIIAKKAETSDRFFDIYTILANELSKLHLALHAAYPEVEKPLTHVKYAMGNDMASLVFSLNSTLETIANTENGMRKTARTALIKDPEYAPYKNALFLAAQNFSLELIKSGINIQDLTAAKFHSLREVLAYAPPQRYLPGK